MSGGGVGNVLSTGASLAAGQSPIGAFGSALGSQLLSGGGGGGSGAAGSAANPYGIGTRNQTQLVGPNAGVNPATSQFFNNQPRPQVQPQPQVLPQVQPQVGARLFNGIVTPNTIGPNGLPVGGGMPAQGAGTPTTYLPPPTTAPTFAQNYMNELAAAAAANPRPVGGGFGLLGTGMPAQQPQVQQLIGGRSLGAPDLSQDAYNRMMAMTSFSGAPPTYEQWVQQRSAMQNPMNMPAVFPPKPGVFGPQVRPAQGLGLAGLAGMLQGYK